MGDRTVEDVLLLLGETEYPPGVEDMLLKWNEEGVMEPLREATADGPVFSKDGSIAVIRTDPQLAQSVRWHRDAFYQQARPGAWDEGLVLSGNSCGEIASLLDRLLPLLAAPADSEED